MAAGFQTQAVTDVLKKHIPSHFSTLSLSLVINASDLQLSEAVTGSFMPAEELLAGLKGSRTHLLNPVDDVASSASHLVVLHLV